MKEGRVRYLNYLLAKADAPNSELPDISNVREWSYKDLLRLPMSQQKEWMDACYQELDSLCKHDVYDLVNPPPERRIIRNRWVFDRKTDGVTVKMMSPRLRATIECKSMPLRRRRS
jgi:hypothetical protein